MVVVGAAGVRAELPLTVTVTVAAGGHVEAPDVASTQSLPPMLNLGL